MLGHSIGTARLLIAGGLILLSAAAEAQIRYVASTGNDSRPCTSAAAPCLTLQRGILATPAGGEVRVLGSIYGGGTIDRSLTISADGATIMGRIFINNANAVVTLRDINLNGAGSRDVGIQIIAASAVHIEHCTVERFTVGIYSGALNVEFFVLDSIVRDNSGGAGLMVYEPGLTAKLTVDNSRFMNNGADGLYAYGISSAITRTVMSGNHGRGIVIDGGSASITSTTAAQNENAGFFVVREAVVTLEAAVSHGNASGLYVLDATANVSGSVFTNNAFTGITNASGTIRTRGNNTVVDNATDVDGTLDPLPGT